jgi:hypothetical protein
VTSDKAYAAMRRIDLLYPMIMPGPWTQFTLANGWSRTGGWSKIRWMPGNLAFLSCLLVPGTDTDGIQLGTVVSPDANGNVLTPAQQVVLPASTDTPRNTGTTSIETVYFTITSAGSIFCHGFAGAATFAEVNCFYPLDTM